MPTPHINVTPLIDVLLVLLIIFMVVSPLKPSAFQTRVPSEPPDVADIRADPFTLLVTVGSDSSLRLNTETAMGTTGDPGLLIARLRDVFEQRAANGNVSALYADAAGRPTTDRTERTVFIKAPRKLAYGAVARVVDAVKMAGAFPISLQIDDLE